MISALIVSNVLLALIVLVELGAVTELFKQVQQVRSHLRLDDLPDPFQLKQSGVLASAVGLPGEIDSTESAVVLVLSPNCVTCRQLASALASEHSGLTDRLWILIEPAFDHSVDDFIAQNDIRYHFMVDTENVVADSLGVDTTPLALIFEQGRVTKAMTVPSPRQMARILKEGGAVQMKAA